MKSLGRESWATSKEVQSDVSVARTELSNGKRDSKGGLVDGKVAPAGARKCLGLFCLPFPDAADRDWVAVSMKE